MYVPDQRGWLDFGVRAGGWRIDDRDALGQPQILHVGGGYACPDVGWLLSQSSMSFHFYHRDRLHLQLHFRSQTTLIPAVLQLLRFRCATPSPSDGIVAIPRLTLSLLGAIAAHLLRRPSPSQHTSITITVRLQRLEACSCVGSSNAGESAFVGAGFLLVTCFLPSCTHATQPMMREGPRVLRPGKLHLRYADRTLHCRVDSL